MLSQLALSFPKIEKEIFSRICPHCNEDLNEVNERLNFTTDNQTSIEEQRKLLILLEGFSEMDKETIIKKFAEIWANIFVCKLKLLHRVEESNEVKIIRELCLHVLWNLLSNPKKVKYRQINNGLLFRNIKNKCDEMKVEMDPVLTIIRHYLKEFGFENKIDGNWSYCGSVPSLSLWKHYCEWTKKQLIYKTNRCVPKTVFMCSKEKWREYEIAFDYQHRTIMLLNKLNEEKDEKEEQDKFKIEALQVGNPRKSSLEVNVHIQWYNNFDDIANCIKWPCLILNHSWHFRANNSIERRYLSNLCAVDKIIYYVASVLQQQQQSTKKKFISHFNINRSSIHSVSHGQIMVYINETFDTLTNSTLHNKYKHIPHFPAMQADWEIKYEFVVPYERTIGTERNSVPKIISNENIGISAIEKPGFHPFLYKTQQPIKNELKHLLHEVISNGYLYDLIASQNTTNPQEEKAMHENIKQQIQYNESDINALILNDKILTILSHAKQVYRSDVHRHMGYPLELHHICAILLYCGKSCSVKFSYDQMNFKHFRWLKLDSYLQSAITILSKHERREESEMELYCELKNVKFANIGEINAGYFISYVSTTDILQDTQTSQTDRRCILHFHPSMRRAKGIFSCNVSWILPFKDCHVLFSRPHVEDLRYILIQWYARVESENENTQVILLTWTYYDNLIRSVMRVSTVLNHSLDLNLISMVLINQKSINAATLLLSSFEKWKKENNNEERYIQKMHEFVKQRCCNHQINMFCIFIRERAKLSQDIFTLAITHNIINGLPFTEKDKNAWIKTKTY
ncbi:hypothetical protein RFI_36219 [Reticulomyxa filosa]|uniref:Uncharacterized protein n=1 Tax=Reticulomyxa filosa TaxID=46433 RepID=X6LKG2_RETFI|nr:hypothetical protein RFI_36219 [Reticulomyxa filosa]|eukprot:ETO01220.1 hypothetical protein RFI_36219 [Reticulomyxa filosa]